jgi:branched-subunit amino acid aminotransferase/4-amino-4-deoxychorismate lyase
VKEASFTPEDLLAASEVFLTGTTAGVWPVASVDDQPIGGEGSEPPPGPVARRLGDRFRRIVAGEDPEFAGWLSYVSPG